MVVRVSQKQQERIFIRDQHMCQYCGWCLWCDLPNVYFKGSTYITVDHIIPLSAGGSRLDENIVTACWPCNAVAANFVFVTFEDKLRWLLSKREDALRATIRLHPRRAPGKGGSREDGPVLRVAEATPDDEDVPGYVRPMHKHGYSLTHAHPNGGKPHSHRNDLAPEEVLENDLPGMWSQSDFLGGYQDPNTCDHEWPPEIYGHSRCRHCGLPYDQWAYQPDLHPDGYPWEEMGG